MRVWVDLTNSPHVLVFRPLIELLRGRGDEVEVTAREYAQTMQLLELHGIEATDRRPSRRRVDLRQGASRARTGPGAPDLGQAAPVRPRARTRVARPDPDRPVTGDPERHDVRLRVRLAPAPAGLPRGDPRRRAGRDPTGAIGPLRGTEEAPPLSGAEGGVLPRRLRALVRRSSPGEAARRRPDAAGGVALPPARQPALSGRPRPARARRAGPRDRAAAHGGAARDDSRGSASLR